ncbi:uncharacterized protein METZ01_LOCUS375079, partial [marine metagenome]
GNNGSINGATWSGDAAPVEPPVYGCTDEYAGNYNPDAVADDGSCTDYPQDGDRSLSFDGQDDFVGINVNTENDFSISGWFTFETADDGNAIIASGSNDFIRIDTYDNQKYFGYNSPTGANHRGQTSLSENTWYHFAVTRSGSDLSFYLNGDFDGSFYEPSTALDWVKIGVHRNGTQHHFHGNIDDITFWDTALEQDQVQITMFTDASWQDDNLVAHYRFNANDGGTLFDHSGNANHGNINGPNWDEGFVAPPTAVTFAVNMRGYDGDLSEGVFLAGGNIGSADPED